MPHNEPGSGPVIVGVDGSQRSVEALALADLLGPALRRPVVIAYVHPYGKLSSLFSESEYETLVREVAESTFDQIREHLPSVPERRMQLVSEESPAAGRHALAEREEAALIVIGSSHRSTIGRTLVGGTGERLLFRSLGARGGRSCRLHRRRARHPDAGVRVRRLAGSAAGARVGGRARARSIGSLTGF